MKNIFKIGDIVKITDNFPFKYESLNGKKFDKLYRTVINIDGDSLYLDKFIGNYDKYHYSFFKIDKKETRKQKLKKLSNEKILANKT